MTEQGGIDEAGTVAATDRAERQTGQDDQPDAAPPAPREPVEVRLRRTPRYLRFVLVGAVIGFLIAAIVVSLRDLPAADPGHLVYSKRTILGYLGMIGALFGAVLGAAVAVLADRLHR